MRSRLFGLVLGCGLVAALIAPALACPYHNTVSNDQQQTAQAQPPADANVQY
ncbi:MAG: hypothetical protein ABSC25_03670 [Roseiarcus sp.]|jgi:hypothetical protein